MAKTMSSKQIQTSRYIIFSMWIPLNVLTIVVAAQSTTPTTDAKYLTTQAWLFGFIAKLCLPWQLLCPPTSGCTAVVWDLGCKIYDYECADPARIRFRVVVAICSNNNTKMWKRAGDNNHWPM